MGSIPLSESELALNAKGGVNYGENMMGILENEMRFVSNILIMLGNYDVDKLRIDVRIMHNWLHDARNFLLTECYW